jgi:acetyltransferase-like isoleucine patch superfamily enzyme
MLEGFLLKIRRGETPLYRSLRTVAQRVRDARVPLPNFALPVFGAAFNLYWMTFNAFQWLVSVLLREPMFRGRCASFGRHVLVTRLPFIIGHTKIHVGDHVNFFGKTNIFSGRTFDNPTLIIGDRVDIGHDVSFTVNLEIVLEEGVNVASGVRFLDSDAHPRDTAQRISKDIAPPESEIKPVRIGKYAWIGQNAFIMKGVTVGEGAIIGVSSVVVTDVPPYSVAMGNPARVVVKGLSVPPGPGRS